MSTTVAELEVVVTSDTSQAESGLSGLGGKLKGLSTGQLTAIGAGFTALGGTIAGAFMGSIGVASEFNAQLSAIASVGGADAQASMEQIRQTALDLGSSTAFSASEAAAGMEELIKAGVPVADVLNGAAQSALDLAAATGTSVPEAAELVAITMGQMGVDATTAADVIAQVTNAAAMDVNDFALSFKTAGVQAAALGIPITDLAAVFGVLSQQGIKGEQAGTAVRNMLTSLAAPSAEAQVALDQLGITAFDASGNFVGMESLLAQLQPAFSGMTTQQQLATAEMIVGKDAAAAFIALIQGGPAALDSMTTAMGNAGTASEQAEARTNNFKGAMDTLMGSIETLQITIGSRLLPVLQSIVSFITMVIGAFLGLNPQVQNAILIFAGVVAVLSLVIAGMIAAQIATALLGGSLLAILGPALLVFAAIAALGAAFYYAYSTNLLGFRDGVQVVIAKLQELWSVVQLAAMQIFTTLSLYWTQAQTITESVWGVIGGTVTTAIQLIVTIVSTYISTLFNVILTAFTMIFSVVSNVLQMIVAIFKGDWGAAKDHAISAVQAMLTGVITILTIMLTGLGQILVAIAKAVETEFNRAKSAAVDAASAILTGVLTKITQLWSAVTETFNSIKTAITDALTAAKDSAVTTVTSLVTSVTSALSGLYLAGWQAGWDIGAGLIAGISGIWDSVIGYAGQLADAVYNKIKGALKVFSPSKLTTFIGEMVGQGLIVGMALTKPDVLRSSEQLALASVPGPIMPAMAPIRSQPSSSNQTVVHQTYNVTLSLSEFEELTEAIDFVQGLSNTTQRELYLAF
jgi:TP901 family phage tail tape measure protein